MTTIARAAAKRRARPVEWKTVSLILGCYGAWAGLTALLWATAPLTTVILLGIAIAFHASLTHEAIHGHPFANQTANEAAMALSLNLCIPLARFRDLHLAHHRDSNLTDPYDDPETNYLDPAKWSRMRTWAQWLYRLNNTLAGRILVGPVIGQLTFCYNEWQRAKGGDWAVLWAWTLHAVGVAIVITWVIWTPMPVWAYLVSAYLGLSLLRIRTFAEHRAHERSRARTVIIEDRGPLALLFLNNNLHVVHHMHPDVAWYDLPRMYARGKDRYVACNEGYVFRSYGELFRRHFWRAKDPVAHPLWPRS